MTDESLVEKKVLDAHALSFLQLRRQLRLTQLACAVFAIVSIVSLLAATRNREFLKLRGVTIVDASGHPRILIGAPPDSYGRMRKDAQTASLVVLSEDGKDRVIVGEEPNPVIGGKTYPRIGAAYGLLIHDKTGQERGGIANLDNGRSVISLDRPGQDAVEMVENDKTGFAGLTVNYARPLGEYAEALRLGTKNDEAWWELEDGDGKERAAVRVNSAPDAPNLRMAPAD